MPASANTSPTLCSVVSAQSGEDPAGSAWAVDRYLVIEVPLPWPNNMLESRGMPPGIAALVQQLYIEGIYWGWIGVAPDPEYSVPGMTRMIDYRLPAVPPFGRYARTEYLFPTDRAGDLAERVVRAPEDPMLAPFRQEVEPALRDLLVCTHGTVDACCATFGYPVYKLLRAITVPERAPVRTWRCTHFGGHQFAATLLDLPEGRYWGRLEARDLAHLVRRDVPAAALRHAYRGWSALPHPTQQIAEATLLAARDWAWTEMIVTPLSDPPDEERPDRPLTVAFAARRPDEAREVILTVELSPTTVARTMHQSLTDEFVDVQQYEARIIPGP
jgi:hypothetical protein